MKSESGWSLEAQAVSLDIEEEGILLLQRKVNPGEDEFTAQASFQGDIDYDERYASHTDIPLIPGTYEVSITTLLRPRDPLIIPAREVCAGDTCVNVPPSDIEFNATTPFPIGGAQLAVTIKPEDLVGTKSIEFYAIDNALDLVDENDRTIEDLEHMGSDAEKSRVYGELIKPRFLR